MAMVGMFSILQTARTHEQGKGHLRWSGHVGRVGNLGADFAHTVHCCSG